jgi:hypothetical protein
MTEHIQQTIIPFGVRHSNLVYDLLGLLAEPKNFFEFFRGYVSAVDFTLDDDEEWKGVRWHENAVEAAVRDTVAFFNAHWYKLGGLYWTAGTRFLYARNGDGITFMDDSFPEYGKEFQEAARAFGSLDAYKGDDGLLHTGSEIRYHLAGVMNLED